MAEFKLTPEQVQTAIAAASDQLKESAAQLAEEQLGHLIRHSVYDQIRPEIEAFVRDYIVPEIKARLASEKDGLIAAALECANEISAKLRSAMIAKAEDSLNSDYRVRTIIKEMFGG